MYLIGKQQTKQTTNSQTETIRPFSPPIQHLSRSLHSHSLASLKQFCSSARQQSVTVYVNVNWFRGH